jgi:hypothetical protein
VSLTKPVTTKDIKEHKGRKDLGIYPVTTQVEVQKLKSGNVERSAGINQTIST